MARDTVLIEARFYALTQAAREVSCLNYDKLCHVRRVISRALDELVSTGSASR